MDRSIQARIRRNIERMGRVGFGQYVREKRSRLRYIWRRLLRDSAPHDAKWGPLLGRYAGKRAFLIGNGPSLNRTPLYLLRDEYKMCFNRFYLMLERLNWQPDFHVVVDNLVLNDMLGELDHLSTVTRHLFLPDIHVRGEEYHRVVKQYENLYWLRHHGGGIGFSTRAPKVFGGGSVIYEGLQVLRFLGFTEVALVGVDLNFQLHKTVNAVKGDPNGIEPKADDDPNHFDPRYFGKGRRYHQPEQHVVDNIRNRLRDVASVMDRIGLRVLNAGYDSTVDFFERREFVAYVGKSSAEAAELFDDCVRRHTAFADAAAMHAVLPPLGESEARAAVGSFRVAADVGPRVLKGKVLTHLPLGPYGDSYYFVKRDA